jgi:hypothetical protein
MALAHRRAKVCADRQLLARQGTVVDIVGN